MIGRGPDRTGPDGRPCVRPQGSKGGPKRGPEVREGNRRLESGPEGLEVGPTALPAAAGLLFESGEGGGRRSLGPEGPRWVRRGPEGSGGVRRGSGGSQRDPEGSGGSERGPEEPEKGLGGFGAPGRGPDRIGPDGQGPE